MPKEKPPEAKVSPSGRAAAPPLPPGVKLLHTLEGHTGAVRTVAFDPQGRRLSSGGFNGVLRLWEVNSGTLIHAFAGHHENIERVAFDAKGATLASASFDGTVNLWEVRSNRLLCTLEGLERSIRCVAFYPRGRRIVGGGVDGTLNISETRRGKLLSTIQAHESALNCLVFDPHGELLASGGHDYKVNLWEARSGKLLRTFEGHQSELGSLAFDAKGATAASADFDGTVKLWEVQSGKLLRTLEGHTARVMTVAFSGDGRLLASNSNDHTIRLWNCETWDAVSVISEPVNSDWWTPALAFHPRLRLLATAGSDPDTPEEERCRLIYLWGLDYNLLLGARAAETVAEPAVHHTTGKIVLVGDRSVGKSALGHRLIHGEFKEQASTHGQRFWPFPALGKRRTDGTECEAILWDFAGQPDYRLVHALFVDDADLALVLFDASDLRDPLHGVDFWLEQLQTGRSRCPVLLVAAKTDRGSCTLTPEELIAFCHRHGIVGPIETSAYTGVGVVELVERMKSLIPWEDKAATVTTTTFKRIKDYVLGLKEAESDGQTIVTPEELRDRLEAIDASWQFTDAEMMTAVGHLENYGYVKRLRTSQGEERVLLEPERLNNLASSFVLEARRNLKGLGALEEKRLATDLQKAGVEVILDRWHNAQVGASVARFVARIEKSDRILMIGTPLYRRKYENKETSTGYVVAAEVDMIHNRLLGTEAQKESVLPLLLEGEKTDSRPPLLHGRVYADFRHESNYFTATFDLILSLYRLPPTHPAVVDLRESLRGPEML